MAGLSVSKSFITIRPRIRLASPWKQLFKLDHKMTSVDQEKSRLDEHVREIVRWHFSPETGCPFWLEWASKSGWNPVEEVKCFEDLSKFPNFRDEFLRDEPPKRWIPKAYEGRPYRIFETGGTTGMPKQRI